jgi:hypothetical protein
MSEENPQNLPEEARKEDMSAILPQGFELIVNKATNEITLKDSAGHAFTLKATVIEESDEEEEIPPLTPEQFRDALQRIDALGLTWTADQIPRVKAKEPTKEEALLGDEFERIQQEYPTLPPELSVAVTYALTGSSRLMSEVGGADFLKQKAEIAEEIVTTSEYRSEFFFKHSLKVPYLSSIDWEVVFKLEERNVKDVPGVSYALLTLLFHDPTAEGNKHRTTTVALDAILVNKLIASLTEVKDALERGNRLSKGIHEKSRKDGDDEIPK